MLHAEGLDAYVVRRLGLPFRDVDWTEWDDLLRRVHRPARHVTVALVGKYVDLPDAYLSVTEALRAGGFANDCQVDLRWVTSDDCQTPEGAARELDGVDAVCIPGGFGVRGIEGKLGAVRYARENRIPTLGLCLGLQCMVIEYARNVAGLEGANSTEFDDATAAPGHRHDGRPARRRRRRARHGRHDAARPLPRQARRGLDRPARSTTRPTSRSATGTATRSTTPTAAQLEEAGLRFSGTSPDGRLVEYVELPRDVHPYFVATQAHPEFRSRPTRPHPLFAGLIEAAVARQDRALVELTAADRLDGLTGVARRWSPSSRSPTRRPHCTSSRSETVYARAGLGRAPRHRRPR